MEGVPEEDRRLERRRNGSNGWSSRCGQPRFRPRGESASNGSGATAEEEVQKKRSGRRKYRNPKIYKTHGQTKLRMTLHSQKSLVSASASEHGKSSTMASDLFQKQRKSPPNFDGKIFLHAMTSLGFNATKMFGSVWRFEAGERAQSAGLERSINFHEPHGNTTNLGPWKARRYGRRLTQVYGIGMSSLFAGK